jgi:hypothetical protein
MFLIIPSVSTEVLKGRRDKVIRPHCICNSEKNISNEFLNSYNNCLMKTLFFLFPASFFWQTSDRCIVPTYVLR